MLVHVGQHFERRGNALHIQSRGHLSCPRTLQLFRGLHRGGTLSGQDNEFGAKVVWVGFEPHKRFLGRCSPPTLSK